MRGHLPDQASESVPAAQYVRMSTEDQQFSIANQQEAIRRFADAHAYNIVCLRTRFRIDCRRRSARRQVTWIAVSIASSVVSRRSTSSSIRDCSDKGFRGRSVHRRASLPGGLLRQ